MDYNSIIKEIGRGKHHARDLDRQTAYALYRAILAGEVPEMELGALLIAMRIKAEAPEELIGFYQAMQEQVMALQPPASRPPPIVIPSYNGARKQANLTPLLALARLGFPVVVHGVTDDPGRVTSANIFRELGINGVTSRDEAQVALDRQLSLRWRLGVRNSAHTLAKLATPFSSHSHWRLCSVSHPEYIPRVAGFFSAINATALLMNGTEGESYANPKRLTRIYHVRGGEPQLLLDPAVNPLPPLESLPDNREAAVTARWTEDCLDGRWPLPQAIRLQLGCCLVATGQCADLPAALLEVDNRLVRL
ncbi:DNA-binding protein YbiB [Candidatus Sodalis endolongispinus]|uniref:DNA-binding protein YbiB n=1 Tax=Candidatus Sodalis endolongispinus TaxID=2812662 RepID=A0ABS5YEK5_9GAMM|nr:DNA-binding protein YbiB [Candidatus Sodalis endolongispinus]MBT9433371.1 DNA-binding protein YbiB [Candidatus Sodalis endolongispinus]